MWHLHKWSNWETIEEGDIESVSKFDPNKPKLKYGNYLVQRKTCSVCNKIHLRTERTP